MCNKLGFFSGNFKRMNALRIPVCKNTTLCEVHVGISSACFVYVAVVNARPTRNNTYWAILSVLHESGNYCVACFSSCWVERKSRSLSEELKWPYVCWTKHDGFNYAIVSGALEKRCMCADRVFDRRLRIPFNRMVDHIQSLTDGVSLAARRTFARQL